MGCTRPGESWWRAAGRLPARPETFLLLILGLGLMVAGIVLDESSLVTQAGPGVLILAVIVSIVETVKVSGFFEATFRKPERELDFEEYARLHEADLRELAKELGATQGVTALVKSALVQSHEHLEEGEGVFRAHVVCLVVHRVLGADRRSEQYRNALDVLVRRGYGPEDMAGFLGLPVDRVRQDLTGATA